MAYKYCKRPIEGPPDGFWSSVSTPDYKEHKIRSRRPVRKPRITYQHTAVGLRQWSSALAEMGKGSVLGSDDVGMLVAEAGGGERHADHQAGEAGRLVRARRRDSIPGLHAESALTQRPV
ncbi:hypothetical protein ANN_10309 [Periplaneta americana]|uniref:Uncharacterized protein n=1 Tax=Periplaneta americana TaxID=6978 RepID=A0ABQ8TRG3_PERAM|nr:hypothetical protein ANN_10309 [Periplaneta americana]